jgi:hypothetical protein
LVASLLSISSCADRRSVHAPPTQGIWGTTATASAAPPPNEGRVPPAADNIVLVTLDGVRWQEIFEGADAALATGAALPREGLTRASELTPNLHRLFFDEGVVLGDPRLGEGVFASGPRFVSLPGYLEIMTGAPSGCGGNDCSPDVHWTIAEEIGYRTGTHGDGVAVFSSWERVARTIPGEDLLLRAGRGSRDEAPPYPGSGAYRPDHGTAALAVEHLVRHRPRFLWVALGDTDEWAHKHDYRGYVEALRFADAFVGELAAHLATMGEYGTRTTLMVTTDHGRDENFADHGGAASAGVWLMARGGPVQKRGVAAPTKRRYLRDIAPTISAILHQPVGTCAACGEVLDELL